MKFQVYGIDDSPPESRATLEKSEKKFGFVPNVLGLLAESPAALETYVSAFGAFERSDLTPVERQVVLLAASRENRCDYCMAAHSMAATRSGVSDSVVDALRNGVSLPDSRLEALRRFTRTVVAKRGWVTAEDLDEVRREGFTERHVLEVVLGVTLKTLSNYTNHLAHPPLDDAFRAYEWTDGGEGAAEHSCCAAEGARR